MPNANLPEPSRAGNLPGPLAARALQPATGRALAPGAPPTLSRGPDLFGILRALRRRWLVAGILPNAKPDLSTSTCRFIALFLAKLALTPRLYSAATISTRQSLNNYTFQHPPN